MGRRGKASTIRRGGGGLSTTGSFSLSSTPFQGNFEEMDRDDTAELGEDDSSSLAIESYRRQTKDAKHLKQITICITSSRSDIAVIKRHAEALGLARTAGKAQEGLQPPSRDLPFGDTAYQSPEATANRSRAVTPEEKKLRKNYWLKGCKTVLKKGIPVFGGPV